MRIRYIKLPKNLSGPQFKRSKEPAFTSTVCTCQDPRKNEPIGMSRSPHFSMLSSVERAVAAEAKFLAGQSLQQISWGGKGEKKI